MQQIYFTSLCWAYCMFYLQHMTQTATDHWCSHKREGAEDQILLKWPNLNQKLNTSSKLSCAFCNCRFSSIHFLNYVRSPQEILSGFAHKYKYNMWVNWCWSDQRGCICNKQTFTDILYAATNGLKLGIINTCSEIITQSMQKLFFTNLSQFIRFVDLSNHWK